MFQCVSALYAKTVSLVCSGAVNCFQNVKLCCPPDRPCVICVLVSVCSEMIIQWFCVLSVGLSPAPVKLNHIFPGTPFCRWVSGTENGHAKETPLCYLQPPSPLLIDHCLCWTFNGNHSPGFQGAISQTWVSLRSRDFLPQIYYPWKKSWRAASLTSDARRAS